MTKTYDISFSTPTHVHAGYEHIQNAAKFANETVTFFQLEDDLLGGGPTIIISCTDEFMEQIKQLPNVTGAQENAGVHALKEFTPPTTAKRNSLKRFNPFKR